MPENVELIRIPLGNMQDSTDGRKPDSSQSGKSPFAMSLVSS